MSALINEVHTLLDYKAEGHNIYQTVVAAIERNCQHQGLMDIQEAEYYGSETAQKHYKESSSAICAIVAKDSIIVAAPAKQQLIHIFWQTGENFGRWQAKITDVLTSRDASKTAQELYKSTLAKFER